jgi:hypothetical protein
MPMMISLPLDASASTQVANMSPPTDCGGQEGWGGKEGHVLRQYDCCCLVGGGAGTAAVKNVLSTATVVVMSVACVSVSTGLPWCSAWNRRMGACVC